ncbi:GrpB family protein [Emticicia sp. W12TSBA100-4]|uniref:GrpB family protein n=1 Tax=Emticicia sp. W12TSBA100-4 TaxID=3160965 RepID=UPI0033067723
MLIQEYQEKWVEDFKAIESVITDALIGLNISIEHVGSTAVPKLAAKPIIDVDIVYGKNVPFEILKKKLEKIGYYHNGNQGIINREVFKRKNWWSKHQILDTITHHLYVCPVDSEELQRHIAFRNYLIANEAGRAEYQQLKYEIAAAANQDKKQYAALKEVKARAFINDILTKAGQL